MEILLGGFLFGLILPFLAIVVAVVALARARRRPRPEASEARVLALEGQVRDLLERVRSLEQSRGAGAPAPTSASPVSSPVPAEPVLAAARSLSDITGTELISPEQ